jgi:predicted transcriptional regulator
MTLQEVADVLEASFLTRGNHLHKVVRFACGCDLMSDVLAFIKAEALLLTGLTNTQVIYTAEVADIDVVCFVRGKKPEKDVIALAEEKDITLMATDLRMFESCGRLYREGLAGCSEVKG